MPVTHPSRQFHYPECDGDAIRVHDLSFAYPDGHAALQCVSLRLCQGEKAALVGPNGAGKSTLMLHLNGILSGEGQVMIADMPLNPGNLPLIRGMVGR